MKQLVAIQSKLKAPKSQYNSFGKYKYRNCEDILEAVKPLLAENDSSLTICDEMVEVGGRIYVKATATLTSPIGSVSASAFAREADNKKGMDEAQLTGATSSYARKYALNGLFAIDDTKDADSTNTHGKEPSKAPVKPSVPDLKSKVEDFVSNVVENGFLDEKEARQMASKAKTVKELATIYNGLVK